MQAEMQAGPLAHCCRWPLWLAVATCLSRLRRTCSLRGKQAASKPAQLVLSACALRDVYRHHRHARPHTSCPLLPLAPEALKRSCHGLPRPKDGRNGALQLTLLPQRHFGRFFSCCHLAALLFHPLADHIADNFACSIWGQARSYRHSRAGSSDLKQTRPLDPSLQRTDQAGQILGTLPMSGGPQDVTLSCRAAASPPSPEASQASFSSSSSFLFST